MKQIFALVVAFTITTTAFSQAGQKWSTSGNTSTSGDFIGSINYEPLIFKTNNNRQGAFTADGDFQLTSLKGTGFNLLQTNDLGIIGKFPLSNANEVLYGDGVWRPLPTPPPSTWELNGTSLFYLGGKVGIGTNTPFTNFDVIGDAYISNNLYVGGGIIITEKINANKEVLTAALRADSIVMDSTKAVYGYSVFKDQVRLENKLQVVGNTQIDGNFRVNGDFIFGNNKRIGYSYPSGGDPEIINFGRVSSPSPIPNLPCLFPTPNVPTLNQFDGMIQAINTSIPSLGGTTNILSMGFDGANGIIDMSGTNTQGGPGLLINYYCGKDVAINTGINGGNVIMTSEYLGKVGIGTGTPTTKLDVLGSFRLRDGSQGANKVLVSDADGVASWQNASTIEDGDWTINGSDIYRLTGNIGIGTTTPTKTLDVSGTLRVGDGNTNFLDIWYDGAHNIIDAKGADLLINYYANKNCVIGPGSLTASGVFTAQKDAYFATNSGNVGIGTSTPQAKLDVVGSFRLNNGSEGANKVLVSDANGIASWQLPNTLDGGGWTINGANIYRASGNVGIGTSSPNYTLDVEGNISVRSNAIVLIDENHGLSHGNSLSNDLQVDGPFLYGWGGGSLGINHSGNYTKVLNWNESGKVGIGVDIPSEVLDVNGNIKVRTNGSPSEKPIAIVNTSGTDVFRVMGNGNVYATKILVRNTPFPDYVFNSDYKLMSLMDLEKYIITNKHLPNMPTAETVEKEGADIGEINRLLVEKTEELTLYIIELKKELNNLKEEVNILKK